MFTHDVIKIQYNRLGYLPNWPYHLISDEEMCKAFIKLPDDFGHPLELPSDFFGPTSSQTKKYIGPFFVDWFVAFKNSDDIMFFKDNYPLIDESIESYYKELVNRIFYEIQCFSNDLNDERVLPDWLYSYMLGIAIGPASDKLDIHDMISAMGVDNLEDDYNLSAAIQCLKISRDWLRKLIVPEGQVQRPPTMFGEPHVLKSIRLDQESLTLEDLQS